MENIQKFVKKLNFKSGGRLFGFGSSPEADWKVIFISSAVLAISFVIFATYIFIKIGKGEIFVAESIELHREALDASVLNETVSYYQNKAMEFENIKNTDSLGVDPSL